LIFIKKLYRSLYLYFYMIKIFPVYALLIVFLSSCSLSPGGGNMASDTIKKPYEIGSVSTAFKLIGANHKIEIGGVPDPKVSGVTCFYSRAKTGGITGSIGLATDTSDASVACRQTGPIVFTAPIKKNEQIWSADTSILFKSIQIIRMYDVNSNSLVYLVYSDKLIDGSPKNSISAVALETVVPSLEK
jgi:CreA protein